MYARKRILSDHFFADYDRVLVVISVPRHESYKGVFTDSQLAALHRRTVGDDLPGRYAFAFFNDRMLRESRVLVGS